MNTKYKKMNVLFKIVYVLSSLFLCIYLDDYERGSGLGMSICFYIFGLIIEKLLNKYWGYGYDSHFLRWTGIGLAIVCFVALGQGVHITEETDGVKIYSPFLKRGIDSGQRLKKLKLRTYYTKYYHRYNVESENYYFLYHFQGDSSYISVYNSLSKVLQLPDTCFTIKEINGAYGGCLQYIHCDDKDYYLRVNQDVVDITPEYL